MYKLGHSITEATDEGVPSASKPLNYDKIDRNYIRIVRYSFQWGLFSLICYGGYQLYLFQQHFAIGEGPLVERPALVDGFLPIGSLMTLKLWLAEGIFDAVHPAGLVIFATALLMSIFLKKSFCGWICPVGTLSEFLYKIGAKIFGRNFRIHRYSDYPLRSIKYLLLGFFLYIVLIKMSNKGIAAFLGTPYWKVADIKMLFFFTDMTVLTMVVLASLIVLSLFFKNFWCRYLCPYGALVGLLSLLSPVKISRNDESCIHCNRCSNNCPSLLPVEKKNRIRSPECTGCLTCVSRCPARGALDMSLNTKTRLRPMIFVVLVAVTFFGIIGVAKLTGHWQSAISYDEYKALIPAAERFIHP